MTISAINALNSIVTVSFDNCNVVTFNFSLRHLTIWKMDLETSKKPLVRSQNGKELLIDFFYQGGESVKAREKCSATNTDIHENHYTEQQQNIKLHPIISRRRRGTYL